MEILQACLGISIAIGAILKSHAFPLGSGQLQRLANAQIVILFVWVFVCMGYSIQIVLSQDHFDRFWFEKEKVPLPIKSISPGNSEALAEIMTVDNENQVNRENEHDQDGRKNRNWAKYSTLYRQFHSTPLINKSSNKYFLQKKNSIKNKKYRKDGLNIKKVSFESSYPKSSFQNRDSSNTPRYLKKSKSSGRGHYKAGNSRRNFQLKYV